MPYQSSATLTATVKPTYGGTPTGVVAFTIGSSTTNANLVNGVATLTVTEPAGIYLANAAYQGTATAAPSTSPTIRVTFQASPITTSTTLTVTPNPVVQGNLVSLSATVSDSNKDSIPGSVTFTSQGVTVGTATLSYNSGNETNTATFIASSQGLALGTYTVIAEYRGADNYQPSTSPGVQVTVEGGELRRKSRY